MMPGRLRSFSLGALLLVALVVTGFVTWQAYQASRQEKAIVERVLREYVAFASYQLEQNIKTSAYNCLGAWFNTVAADAPTGTIADVPLTACGNTGDARFAIDLATGTMQGYGSGSVPPALPGWLQDTLPRHPALPFREPWKLGLLVHDKLPSDAVIVYAIRPDATGPGRALGFVSRSWLSPMLANVLRTSPLLPPEFTGGAPADRFFETTLGREAPSAAANSLFAKTTRLDAAFGGFTLGLRLQPAALRRIVPQGIPRDRSWQLLALLVLACGLVLAALLLLRREAQLARVRADFVSSVSHELRTPLAQIRMFAEMLSLGRVRSETDRQRSLEIIDKEARRLSHLVENVLQVARSERATGRVHATETRLAPVVRDTVESFMALHREGELAVRLELQDDLVAPADAQAVRQILLNLLDNAAKYGPARQQIVAGLAIFDGAARLWVDDEGPGVPPHERQRVFEMFYRAARDVQSQAIGSGLGLGIVRELTSLHGGRTWIEAAPQGGARVVVEFPNAFLLQPVLAGDPAVA